MKDRIVVIVIAFVIFLVLLPLAFYKGTKAEIVIDDKYYPEPIIDLVMINQDNVTINAGMYYYGDLNLDGKINDSDIKYMHSLLNETLTFKDAQKALVDFDMDGEVTEFDLGLLEEYVEKYRDVEYNTYSKELLYCINKEDNSDSCSWKDYNTLNLGNYGDYYAFVKNETDNIITKSEKLVYKKIELQGGLLFDN